MRQAFVLLVVLLTCNLMAAEINSNGGRETITTVSRVMSYQGILKDNAGDPVPDASYDIIFRIYDDAAAGNLLWTSATIPVTTKDGYFTTEFEPTGLAFDITYYLSIQVGADPEMAIRQKMTTSPYAIIADTTDVTSLWHNGGNVIYTGGNWGIARGNSGNMFYGVGDSTHVNFGVACTTGVSGQDNYFCTVAGGYRNTAGGRVSFVGGGQRNTASDTGSFIGGGRSNSASGVGSTLSGGQSDTASGGYSTIGGGRFNKASDYYAAIGGGIFNIAGAHSATVAGGAHNNAIGISATIGGGLGNTASDYYSAVGGGVSNTASGVNSTVSGGNTNTASGDNSTVSGGYADTASGDYATVSGGIGNTASGSSATVAGGYINAASSFYSTIGGGYSNTASGGYAAIAGGQTNTASGSSATIAGGASNTASGLGSAVGGGIANQAHGGFGSIPGGTADTITIDSYYSMAFGYGVYNNSLSRVIFYDGSTSGGLSINRDDRDGSSDGPLQVGTSTANGNGAYLTAGGVWTNGSSRTFKENFTPFNGEELLSKISNLSITTYNYKGTTEKHVGPVAEEFVGAFDTGVIKESNGRRDDMYLSGGDVAGVALAGVQELLKKIEQLEKEIAELKAQQK